MPPSIEDLQDALVELYRASVKLLKGRQLHYHTRSKYVVDGAVFRTEEEDVFAWDLLVEEGSEVLTPLESYDTVRRWLEEEPDAAKHMNRMVGIADSRHGTTVLNCVSSFLDPTQA